MLKTQSRFEIDDLEGNPLTETQMLSQHYDQVLSLQKQCFAHFKVGSINNQVQLTRYGGFYCLNV